MVAFYNLKGMKKAIEEDLEFFLKGMKASLTQCTNIMVNDLGTVLKDTGVINNDEEFRSE